MAFPLSLVGVRAPFVAQDGRKRSLVAVLDFPRAWAILARAGYRRGRHGRK